MSKIRVFTKQHENVLSILKSEGRYVAKRRFAANELEDQQKIMLLVYDWLSNNSPKQEYRPEDAECPVWLSFDRGSTMRATEGFVVMEFEIERELIFDINISKWGTIMNYGYIPANDEDKRRHEKLLKDYGVDDARAVMTNFYPSIKSEIIRSWNRLFDESIILEGTGVYGAIWELKKEWLIDVER